MHRLVRSMLFGSGVTPPAADVGLSVLRVFAGLTLATAHGWEKLTSSDARQGLSNMIDAMGLPAPQVGVALVVLAEFFAALLLALGLFTRIAALLILINMLVAGIGWHLMHADDPYSDAEPALLFAAIAFAFVLTGGGRFSVDRLLRGTTGPT